MKQKLITLLNKIEKDKYMHSSIGAIFAFLTAIPLTFVFGAYYAVVISFVCCTGLFLCKEFSDHQFSGSDMVANYSIAMMVWCALLI